MPGTQRLPYCRQIPSPAHEVPWSLCVCPTDLVPGQLLLPPYDTTKTSQLSARCASLSKVSLLWGLWLPTLPETPPRALRATVLTAGVTVPHCTVNSRRADVCPIWAFRPERSLKEQQGREVCVEGRGRTPHGGRRRVPAVQRGQHHGPSARERRRRARVSDRREAPGRPALFSRGRSPRGDAHETGF